MERVKKNITVYYYDEKQQVITYDKLLNLLDFIFIPDTCFKVDIYYDNDKRTIFIDDAIEKNGFYQKLEK
jgi:hypothetical protein